MGGFRLNFAGGYPMQQVDDTTPDHAEQLRIASSSALPEGLYFDSLQENRALCMETGFQGWHSQDLQRGTRPPAPVVAAWVRSGVLRRAIAACPQAALLVLLLHVEAVLAAPEGADMHEAGRVHLQYTVVKEWLLQEVFPREPWETVLADWPLAEVESRLFNVYKRLLSNIYNELSDTVQPTEEVGPGDSTRSARFNSLTSGMFYEACPQISMSTGIALLSSITGGELEALEGPIPVSMAMVGNALSSYWHVRGLAALAGVAFQAVGGWAGSSFVRFLPRVSHPVASANVTALRSVCEACPLARNWKWPHQCLGAWTHVQQTMRAETQQALRFSGAWTIAQAMLRPRDVVVHLRCFPFFNSNYPLAGFSLYRALPPAWSRAVDLRFIVMAGVLGPMCQLYAASVVAMLRRSYPQASILQRFNTTKQPRLLSEDLASDAAAEADFALLVAAPLLVRSPSSFSLWAGLAREGPVVSAANPEATTLSDWGWRTLQVTSSIWYWVSVPLLTGDVVARHGFVFEQPVHWIQWLEQH